MKVVMWYDNEWGYSQRVVDLSRAEWAPSKEVGLEVRMDSSGRPAQQACEQHATAISRTAIVAEKMTVSA